ncbi:metallophosphoesterase [Lysinibacillus irui]|uniref:Metallophosphoesterase n=1 Tax=Lysinibacillus irui TaxID=2998077 RepID=A0ABU5NIU9_9BACI|nr:metallophosphoesterase [Lysinibacillus irui]MEA0553576.1 metallophosphoesterase [Lysinibacillus irui]MEA0975960.1 metallophosphoesterase [Lysinibacillus irui]MEA1042114.1 metallophosphoesterase [Lysinibacillus irui]
MRIIHLSDIHFSKNHQNKILEIKEAFLKSVKSTVIGEEDVLILVAGDIANWGLKEEYENIAKPFFEELKNILVENGPIKVDFLFIPGNHDCNFSDPDAEVMRELLIKQVKEKNELFFNEKIKESIIIQKDFNDFANDFHSNWMNIESIYSNDLVSLLCYKNKLNLLVLNTAWITTKNEKAGEMYFIESLLKEAIEKIEYPTLTIMHHPTHWLEPNNKRNIDKLIQSVSSVVISGHEHSKTEILNKNMQTNTETLFIEGSCLQELGNDFISEYNVITIKEGEMELNNNLFSYEDKIYKRVQNGDFKYKIVNLNANKVVNEIVINQDFDAKINELGIVISHPRKKDVNLNDLFVFPDVEEIIKLDKEQELIENINISEVLDYNEESVILFSGEKDSGKSTLIKMLFKYKYGEDLYPMVVNAEDIKKDHTYNTENFITYNFNYTYEKEGIDEYLQLSKSKRILFIEDWNKALFNEEAKNRFLVNAVKYFSQVILFIDSESSPTNYFISGDLKIRQFKILEFGHVKRDELIEKWINLGQEDYIERAKLLNEIDRYKRAMEPILKNGFVPKYPLYLLVMLNSIETRNSHDLEKSSNGYYFEVLIKDSLINLELEFNQIEKLYEYLTNFAYFLLKQDGNFTDLDEWKYFHNNHLELYDMSRDQLEFSTLKSKLIKAKVIRGKDSCYQFYYPYVFNYFVAQYYARNLTEDKVQNELLELTNNIHITENANILMFLTHLSKDKYIIECVITSASILLEEVEPSRLEKDIDEINKLCEEIFIPQVNADLDAYENRKKLNERLDEIEQEQRINVNQEIASDLLEVERVESDEIEVMNNINTINKSFKMLEVLGQILRNYYGSLKGPEKYELSKHHFNLGLRLNKWIINQIENAAPMLYDSIASILSNKNNVSREKAISIANQFIYILASIITRNNIWKIVNSGGTPDLNNTYIRISDEENSVAVNLITLLIKIEYYEEFPYKQLDKFVKYNISNVIVMKIVRDVVKRYIYLNELTYNDKQKICQIAHLKLSPKAIGMKK